MIPLICKKHLHCCPECILRIPEIYLFQFSRVKPASSCCKLPFFKRLITYEKVSLITKVMFPWLNFHCSQYRYIIRYRNAEIKKSILYIRVLTGYITLPLSAEVLLRALLQENIRHACNILSRPYQEKPVWG